ncbi:MAG TPA: disulfide bond formation protein B [Gammaproteobacteria bacterium]|jgi:disulfide bond formation protein DsbB|nr:disulfide bond formation protein B [Gammaproteobacteria bacterium]
MNIHRSIRLTNFIGFSLIVILLGSASFVESYLKMIPCPLCLLQRFVMVAIGVIFLLNMLGKFHKYFYTVLTFLGALLSISGLLLAGRQVWLQHIPKEGLGECGVSLSYMLKILPFFETIQHVWRGGIECSEPGVVFLNLSLAEWSFIWFGIFFILFIIQQRKIYLYL